MSDPYEVVDGKKHYFAKDGEVFAYKEGRKTITLQRFGGEKMNEVKRRVIEKERGFHKVALREFNGKCFLFTSAWDEKDGLDRLFVQEIDFEKCNFVENKQLLLEYEGKLTGRVFDDYYVFLYDKANHPFLIEHKKKEGDGEESYLFDAEFNLVWKGVIKLPYSSYRGSVFDSKGNKYYLSIVEEDNDDESKRMELIRVDGDDRSVTSAVINLNPALLKDIVIFKDSSDELFLAGYYGGEEQGADGVYLAHISKEGEVENLISPQIPLDVIKKYITEKDKRDIEKLEKKEGKGNVHISLKHLDLKDVHLFDDGSVMLFGGNLVCGDKCHFGAIMVTTITADGELAWMNKYPKKQSGNHNNRNELGYNIFYSENHVYTLFMDSEKNKDLTADQHPDEYFFGSNGVLTCFKIDKETGEAERLSLFTLRDAKGFNLNNLL